MALNNNSRLLFTHRRENVSLKAFTRGQPGIDKPDFGWTVYETPSGEH